MSGRPQYSAVETPMSSSSRSAYTATVPPGSSSAFLRPDAPRSDFLAPTPSRSHRRSSSAVDGTVSTGLLPRSQHRMSFSDARDEQNLRDLREFRDLDRSRNRSSRSSHRGTSSDSRGPAVPGIMFSHDATDPSLDKSRRNSIYDKDRRGSSSRSHHGHSHSHSYSGSASRRDSPEPYSSDEERSGSGKTKKRVLAALAGVVAVGLGVNAIDKKINESNKRRDEIQLEQDRKYEQERERERRASRDHDHDSRSHYSSHSKHSASSHPQQPGHGVIVSPSSRRSDHGHDDDRGRYRSNDSVDCNRSRARDYRMEVSRDRASYYEARTSDDRLYSLGDDEYHDQYSERNF